jgi:Zn-dependent membrane protease YugP
LPDGVAAHTSVHRALIARATPRRPVVIILGLILLLLGFFLDISILWTIGIILLVIGAVLFVLGSVGRSVGGRRHYW